MKLVKADIVKAVAERTGQTQKASAEMYDTLIDVMKEALIDEHKVAISGFGTFEVLPTKERNGFNPRTREPMIIPASKRVSFSISTVLMDEIKES